MKPISRVKKSLLMILSILQFNSAVFGVYSNYARIAAPAFASQSSESLNDSNHDYDPHDTTNIMYNSEFIIDNEDDHEQAEFLDALASNSLYAIPTSNYTKSYQKLQKVSEDRPLMQITQVLQNNDATNEPTNAYKKAQLQQSRKLMQYQMPAVLQTEEPVDTELAESQATKQVQKIKTELHRKEKRSWQKQQLSYAKMRAETTKKDRAQQDNSKK